MRPTEAQRRKFRETFRSLYAQEFQAWFESIARVLHPPGEFQAVRTTAGDGGLDGLAINSQHVYQVFAPARIKEMRDGETAAKIKADFLRAHLTLGDGLKSWTFVHNHPEGKIGKLTAEAVASLKAAHPTITFAIHNIDSLWGELALLPSDKLALLFGEFELVASLPRVEVQYGKLIGRAGVARGREGIKLVWKLDLSLYIEPISGETVVFPSHKCEAWIQTGEKEWKIDRIDFPIHTLYKSETIFRTENEAVIKGAGKVEIMARRYFEDAPLHLGQWAKARVALRAAGIAGEIAIDCGFEYEGEGKFRLVQVNVCRALMGE